MKTVIALIKKSFYLALDISGSLLGIFLMIVGWSMKNGRPLSDMTNWMVFGLGVAALLIHGSHYLIARKHGSEYFHTTRKTIP